MTRFLSVSVAALAVLVLTTVAALAQVATSPAPAVPPVAPPDLPAATLPVASAPPAVAAPPAGGATVIGISADATPGVSEDIFFQPNVLTTVGPDGGPFMYDNFVKGGKRGAELDPETLKLMKRDRELSAQVAEQAAAYKTLTDDAQRAEVQQKLAALVAEQFNVRQSMRERELAQLAAQLERLRSLHTQRGSQRDRIIADRVQQVLRDAVGLGWGDSGENVGPDWKFRTSMGPRRIGKPQPGELQERVLTFTGAGAPGVIGDAAPQVLIDGVQRH